jgi:hypothetical protein
MHVFYYSGLNPTVNLYEISDMETMLCSKPTPISVVQHQASHATRHSSSGNAPSANDRKLRTIVPRNTNAMTPRATIILVMRSINVPQEYLAIIPIILQSNIVNSSRFFSLHNQPFNNTPTPTLPTYPTKTKPNPPKCPCP